jgi:hypothetical protein
MDRPTFGQLVRPCRYSAAKHEQHTVIYLQQRDYGR